MKKKRMAVKRTARKLELKREEKRRRNALFDTEHFESVSLHAVEKRSKITTVDFCTEMYGAPAKNCSGPENRDASILFGRHTANAMIFSTVFDRFRAPRSIEASASIDSASKKRRSISVQKCTARQQKIVRAPKTAMRRFY